MRTLLKDNLKTWTVHTWHMEQNKVLKGWRFSERHNIFRITTLVTGSQIKSVRKNGVKKYSRGFKFLIRYSTGFFPEKAIICLGMTD